MTPSTTQINKASQSLLESERLISEEFIQKVILSKELAEEFIANSQRAEYTEGNLTAIYYYKPTGEVLLFDIYKKPSVNPNIYTL